MRKILYGEEIRKAIIEGSKVVYETVTSTLGPKAGNVLIGKSYGAPIVTHDGVTAASEVEVEDQFQNLGAGLIIEASKKTNKDAGDGTTTAVLLAHEILIESIRQINNGENSQLIKRQLKEACQKAVEEMGRYAIPIKGRAGMESVAKISSGSAEIGNLVALAYDRVGDNGIVRVDLGHSRDNEMEFREGFVVPKGLVTPHFITDIETLRAEMEDVRVLVTEDEITSIPDILELMKQISEQGNKQILIVAVDINGSALGLLIQNRQLGNLKPIPIQAPGAGELRKGTLEDIATFAGTVVFSQKTGNPVKNATLESLGHVDKVVSDREETVLIGGGGSKKSMSERVTMVKKMIADSKGDFEREGLEERLSKLTGKVAVIYAGGSSETEIKEQRFRIEDAIHATKAAIEEGVVPGGGVTLLRSRRALSEDGLAGERILRSVLDKVTMKVLENAGIDKPHIVIGELDDPNKKWTTFDVMSVDPLGLPTVDDAFKIGGVDPIKVVRSALENAVSVAGELITTCAGIVEIKEEKPPGASRPPMGI